MDHTDSTMFSISSLNAASAPVAATLLEPVIEGAPWLASRVAAARPFIDVPDLARRIDAVIAGLARAEKLAFLQGHPELAPAAPEKMTAASRQEQGRLDLARPSADVAAELAELNRRYRARHGFPFIIALSARKDLDSVIAQFLPSLEADTASEIDRALSEVALVVRARLARLTGAEAGVHGTAET